MITLFMLPGRIILLCFYMFAGRKASTRARSARWKNSQTMTTIVSMAVWAFAIYALIHTFAPGWLPSGDT